MHFVTLQSDYVASIVVALSLTGRENATQSASIPED